MGDLTSQRIFNAFSDRTLPKSEWTHEAHLRVCWIALATKDQTDALKFLRRAVSAYNEATGVENSQTGGYHETLTRYYVGAVASLDAVTFNDVNDAPRCSTTAPLRHLTRTVLFSRTARTEWIEPDIDPLCWSPKLQGSAHNDNGSGRV